MNDSLQYFSTVIYDIFQRSSANCANRAIVRYVQFERKCRLVSFKFLFLLSTTINQNKSYCTHFLLQGFQAVIGKCSCNTLLGLHQNLLSFVDRGIILEPSNLHCKQQSTAIEEAIHSSTPIVHVPTINGHSIWPTQTEYPLLFEFSRQMLSFFKIFLFAYKSSDSQQKMYSKYKS